MKFWFLNASKEQRVAASPAPPGGARLPASLLLSSSRLSAGQQRGASHRPLGVARRPQERSVLRGGVWAWPCVSQHLLHHQLRSSVSVQQQPTSGGLGRPQGQ